MKIYPLLCFFLLLPLTSAADLSKTINDDQLEDRVKAKGYGFQLIMESTEEFLREAQEKYRLIISERDTKEGKNLAACLEKHQGSGERDILSESSACAGDANAIPTNMRNRLQSEMLEGAVYYVREVRKPLLGLLSSNVYSNFTDEIYTADQIASGWQATDLIITHNEPTNVVPGKITLNPGDRRGQIIILNYKIMLASAILMFDTYEKVLNKYLFDEEMRKSIRYMDDRYPDVEKTLIGLWERVESGAILSHLSHAVNYYDRIIDAVNESKADIKIDSESVRTEQVLDKLIQRSLAYQYVQLSPEKLANRSGFGLWWSKQADAFRSWWRNRAHSISQFFGNIVGQGQCRKGVMYSAYHGQDEALDELEGEFKAGDIILEKTPFRSTDKYIPGHYGHVAIWTGSKEELQTYGIWDQLPELHQDAVKYYNYPTSPTFQESVENGARIVEALRSGVEFHTLEHFMDIDDLAVIRPVVCAEESNHNVPNNSGCNTRSEIRRSILNSFQQLGKTYDFAFDTFTKDKIVCSELAYQAYDHVEFDISPSLGSMASISPDQVAFMADSQVEDENSRDPFQPVILFHNGTRIRGDQDFLTEVFNKLLEATDESYDWVHQNTSSKELKRCF